MTNIDELNRVFFHELGHYVANEINKIYFGGTGTESIRLYPCHQDPTHYCGATVPNNPYAPENPRPPLNRLAQNLTAKIYGCIFQAYFLKQLLKDCFDLNGTDDARNWRGLLMTRGLFELSGSISKKEEEYFNNLVQNNLLDSFMNLIPADFLIPEGKTAYRVNLEKLNAKIWPYIADHYEDYTQFKNAQQHLIETGIARAEDERRMDNN